MRRGIQRGVLAMATVAALGMHQSVRAQQAAGGTMALTLRAAIAEALAASPALRTPDDGRTIASIHQRQAAARFGVKITPTVQTGSDPSGYSQRTLGVAATKRLPTGATVQFGANSYQFGEGSSAFRDAGYNFTVSQPLLRGWTSVASADLDQARRNTVSAGRLYADARQQLVVSVADSYFAVVRAQRLVAAAERALERARHLRTASDARSKVGLATELDVLRADLLGSQSEAALVAQRETAETAMDALSTLIGRPADRAIELADADVDVDEPAASPVEDYVKTALATRLEVREARDRIGDAKRAETVARWNLLPPVNLDVVYAKRGLGTAASYAFAPLLSGWRFGISTSYALDRSDESAMAATAKLSVHAAERDAQDAERRAADDVRRAYRAWARTAATLEIQSKAVTLAGRQLRLAQLRYERGVAGNFDVIDAENNLLQAQSGLIGAEVDRALAGLRLRSAAGTLDPDVFQR
jgi:outer membrane protein